MTATKVRKNIPVTATTSSAESNDQHHIPKPDATATAPINGAANVASVQNGNSHSDKAVRTAPDNSAATVDNAPKTKDNSERSLKKESARSGARADQAKPAPGTSGKTKDNLAKKVKTPKAKKAVLSGDGKDSQHNEPDTNADASGGKKTKRQQVESYLRYQFKFRFNELTGGIEFKPLSKENWEELTDYSLNSICREIDGAMGIPVEAGTLMAYLKSDFTPKYHPLQHYFRSLPSQTGTATIDELAGTVQVTNPDLFCLALTKWMVASVANAFEEDGCQNQTCLVLTGGQGLFKTKWLDNLCPRALTKYRSTGKIQIDNKDTLILLATKFIINIDDQLQVLNKKDAETVKTLISYGNITVRRPYDHIASYLNRIASFCGSVNADDFLTDATGSRRFLPFRALAVDLDKAQQINMDKAWAEAFALYSNPDYIYRFTAQDIVEKFANNEDFQIVTPEYELLHQYYEIVESAECANVKLTTTALQVKLQQNSRIQLSIKKLGEALKKSETLQKTAPRNMGGNKVWFLRERSLEEVNKQMSAHEPGDLVGAVGF